ncbi:hypothetical protein OG824_31650 [Streptomyces prunicolor]|uniref:hypothetical protein n=1 Tax=Streptomyces prunicolor TaxID=67348 RepID=UPI00224FE30E|nr:hypothetical protein [Streptomyces prunicolor]MCX5239765.1 hypothetical protein [Streptomyces prunicolor]
MTGSTSQDQQNFRYATITLAIGLTALIAIILGCMWGYRTYDRYQAVQDTKNYVTTSQIKANNRVRLNEIEISQQKQRVKIEQQKAQIRFEKSKGIREAQDEIATTLTPLYVQFEMTEALKEIAVSGKNSSVIYIPTGADGLPVIANAGKK